MPRPSGDLASSSRPETLTERLARQFPDASSVSSSSFDRAQAKARRKLDTIDAEIESLMAALRQEQRSSRFSQSGSIQASVRQLFDQLEKIRVKAASSESTVREITGDIRMLDTAKNNLVGSMTALKRLQMLESGADRLETLTNQNNLREAAQALQAVKALQASFKAFMAVERVATVWKRINQSQMLLKTAAMGEYERFFLHDSSQPIRATQLPDAAQAVDAIGQEAITSLLDWYCTLQLREYRRIFRATDEAGQLDNVSRRFAWFRRVTKQYEEEHAAGFLDSWQADRALTGRFAEVTREDLKSVLIREKARLQVSALLEGLGATLEYEGQASKRFKVPFAELMAANPKAVTATPSGITVTAQAPVETISSVFEPYLGLFVEAQDKALSELMAGYRRQGAVVPKSSPYQQQGPDGAASTAPQEQQHHTVLPSSTELFYFYRQTLEQCARLSVREPFRDLCFVFKRYLRTYLDDVLRPALGRTSETASILRRSTSMDSRANVSDLQKWCLVLNTADYCANTCQQLEGRLKERIHPDLKDVITLEPEREAFLTILSASIQVLACEGEFCVEPAFQRMVRPGVNGVAWNAIEDVQGRSEYLDLLASALEEVAVVIRGDLENKRYLRTWADKIVNLITTKFLYSVVRIRPITKMAAEQLLLDLYEVRTLLMELPQFSPSEASSVLGTSYSKFLEKAIARIEMLLRIVMTPTEGGGGQDGGSNDFFIQEYLKIIGDRSFSNFQKVLELKGLKRIEMNTLIEQFVRRTNEMEHQQGENDSTATSFLSSLDMDPPLGPLLSQPTLERTAPLSTPRPAYSVRGSSSMNTTDASGPEGTTSPRLGAGGSGFGSSAAGKFGSLFAMGLGGSRR